MNKSADRRIIKLAEQLENADIDQETINRIMEGGGRIRGRRRGAGHDGQQR